jgi:hypothetical protein
MLLNWKSGFVAVYGYETWSVTIREQHRLRVLRGIFGLKEGGNDRICSTRGREEECTQNLPLSEERLGLSNLFRICGLGQTIYFVVFQHFSFPKVYIIQTLEVNT